MVAGFPHPCVSYCTFIQFKQRCALRWDLLWRRATALELKDLGTASANTVQEAWTAALSPVQVFWGAAFLENHFLRFQDDGYPILEDFEEYEPDFEVDEVSTKCPASFPMESIPDLESATFDIFLTEKSGSEDAGWVFWSQIINAGWHLGVRTGKQR